MPNQGATHLRPDGSIGSTGLFGAAEWAAMDATAFAAAVRRCGGNRPWSAPPAR